MDIGDLAINSTDTFLTGGEVLYGVLQELGYAGVTVGTDGIAAPVVGIDAIDEAGEILFGVGHTFTGVSESARLSFAVYSGVQDITSSLNAAFYEFDRILYYQNALAVDSD